MSDKHNKTRWTQKVLLNIFSTLFIGLALAVAAHWLLGEEYASRQQAKILAPVAGYFYGTSHRDDITVLLIDDASLNKLSLTWPVPYSYEARLLRAVGRYHPKAVFVDVFFKDGRKASDIGQLVQQICALKDQGVQVYLGATKDEHQRFTLREELESTAGKCFTKVALYFSPDEIDRTAWSYPVSSASQSDAGGAVVNSAAVELYKGLTHTPVVPKAAESNLALTWGSVQSKHGIAWTEQKDGIDSAELYCRDYQGIREMIPGALREYGLDHHEKPICVFHETLLAQDLATNSTAEEELVRKQIKGKTVMIGVALSESRDHVLTPLHGRIPGVYLHAMALDNLLTYGADYPEETSLHLANNRSQRKLFAFLLVSIAIIALLNALTKSRRHAVARRFDGFVDNVQGKLQRMQPGIRRNTFSAGANLIYIMAKISGKLINILFITLVTGGIATFGATVFHIGFISTFSIAMFVVAAEWLEIKEKLSEEFVLKKSR